MPAEDQAQETAIVARYTSGQGNHYFDWTDTEQDNARSLSEKFVSRFRVLADRGKGWDYPYAGWYARLLGLGERGWLPVVLTDYNSVSYDRIPLDDLRPKEWRLDPNEAPTLPLPPPGELQADHRA
jgi:hypothetical protein